MDICASLDGWHCSQSMQQLHPSTLGTSVGTSANALRSGGLGREEAVLWARDRWV